jgi:L-threonylcarbamoyladenylate synthase
MIYPASKSYYQFASDLIKGGDMIVYPTDTLYGLGVDATNTHAIRKLNRLKGRSVPLTIVVSDFEMLEKYANFDSSLPTELNKLLPGPYTILLDKKETDLSPSVTLDSTRIGIRIPGHTFPIEVVKLNNVPIITTSINRHGTEPIILISEMEKEFPHVTIFEDQDAQESLGSTIIDYSVDPPQIVRQGDGIFPL